MYAIRSYYVDNIVFLTLLVSKVPAHQRTFARQFGLLAAMGTRILLLISVAWLAKLVTPLFKVMQHPVSGRDLVLLSGGLFLIYKAVMEIHGSLEGGEEAHGPKHVITSYSIHYTKLYDPATKRRELPNFQEICYFRCNMENMEQDERMLARLKAGCICKGVKLIRLIEAIENGATTVAEVQRSCGIGDGVITSYSIHYTKLYEGDRERGCRGCRGTTILWHR